MNIILKIIINVCIFCFLDFALIVLMNAMGIMDSSVSTGIVLIIFGTCWFDRIKSKL